MSETILEYKFLRINYNNSIEKSQHILKTMILSFPNNFTFFYYYYYYFIYIYIFEVPLQVTQILSRVIIKGT